MNKWIKRTVLGLVIISIVISTIVYLFYVSARNNSKMQLQEAIDNRYLEGKDEMGAYFLDLDTIALHKVKDFDISDRLSWLNVTKEGTWQTLNFDNSQEIMKIMKGDDYEWYNFNMEGFSPFMIILKKTDRGFDIIGEYVLGIGLKYDFPKHLIHQTSYIMDMKKLDKIIGIKTNGPERFYNYSTTPFLVFDYINYLAKDKYKGVLIRNEVTEDQNGFKQNRKLELLEGLARRYAAPADGSLYFRTNKYYELKYDESFTDMGTSPIQWNVSTYGNDTRQLFTRTVTLHYSIQENDGVLRGEYIKRFSIIFLVGIVLYLLIIFGLYKKRKIA